MPRPPKESEVSANDFQLPRESRDDCLDILNSMFFKSIFLRSEKFQMYRSSPEGSGVPSSQQRLEA